MSVGDSSLDEDLLAGVEAPPRARVVIGPSRESRLAHEAWTVWARTTGRPDASAADRQFVYAFVTQVRAGRSHEYLLDVVRGAARLPVKANNANDTRRVINALRTATTAKTAVGALHAGHEIIPFANGDERPLLCSVTDIVTACRIAPGQWGERDQDVAGIIMETMRPEELEAAAIAASRSLGCDGVFPVDVLRAARSAHVSKVSAGRNTRARDTYSAGEAERRSVGGVEVGLDDLAKQMVLRGASDADIVRVHQSAPEGYWDAVFQLALEGYSNEGAYDHLVGRFSGWHPSARAH